MLNIKETLTFALLFTVHLQPLKDLQVLYQCIVKTLIVE
jgi:hypothetical protein